MSQLGCWTGMLPCAYEHFKSKSMSSGQISMGLLLAQLSIRGKKTVNNGDRLKLLWLTF